MVETFKMVGMMMDAMGMILSFTLIYYTVYFHKKDERNLIYFIPSIIFFICLFELLFYAYRYSTVLPWMDETCKYAASLLELILLGLALKLLLENMSYMKVIAKNAGKIALCACIFFPVFHVIRDVIQWNRTADYTFELSYHTFYSARLAMLLLELFLCIVLAIISLIKHQLESMRYALVVLVQIIIFGFVAVLEGMAITRTYNGDGMAYAVSFSFLYTITNTKFVLDNNRKQAALLEDIDMARKIQQDAIPKGEFAYMHHKDIVINSFMATAKEVGGDFYDYFEIDDNHVCFLIADVSGKGMPASLFMMTAKTTIKTIASQVSDTAQIIQMTDKMLAESNESLMFFTAWIGILNTKTLELQYTNAGHNPPVFIGHDGTLSQLKKVSGAMAGVGITKHYTAETLKINTGDRIFLYTDGVPEAHNVKDEQFGDAAMLAELGKDREKSGDILIQAMKARVDAHSTGRDQFDDITMMVIDFNLVGESTETFGDLSFLDNITV